MKNLPRGRNGRILAIAILLGMFFLGFMIFVMPVIGFYEDREAQLIERRELADRLKRSAYALPSLRGKTDDLRQKNSVMGQALFDAPSDAIAAANIQSKIKSLVGSGGGILSSVENLPSQTVNDFHKIGVRVTFPGDLTLLTGVMRGIGTARPVLFMDNIEIHRSSSTVSPTAGQPLTIAFDVYGFKAS